MNKQLHAVLVSGGGRSGTTLLMQILGSSPKVAFDRTGPLENRYLTFLVRSALLARPVDTLPDGWGQTAMVDRNALLVGPIPFRGEIADRGRPLWKDLLESSWRVFGRRARRVWPGATHYAEKTPVWLPGRIEGVIPFTELLPVRDPRDVLASVASFVDDRGRGLFGMQLGEDLATFAPRFVTTQKKRLEAVLAAEREGSATVVRYERLIRDLDGEVARLATLLDLDLDAAAVRAAVPSYRHHMTSGGDESSIGRWRRDLSPAVLAAFTPIAELMAEAGYPPEPAG